MQSRQKKEGSGIKSPLLKKSQIAADKISQSSTTMAFMVSDYWKKCEPCEDGFIFLWATYPCCWCEAKKPSTDEKASLKTLGNIKAKNNVFKYFAKEEIKIARDFKNCIRNPSNWTS
ncbi:unnamed protein product [Lepeophtheirus salmonis]|uniref:(salmon louse) hypothetical protein n=1 Tax=Lepeophtheirus salmonis TaxID=72036 RepID=A0A7R8GZD7_LEPSM|nr:unnamed protein product [Lepeophtheirus salmonis]CAF2752048.1 unnamed protein product [Lepeophtheirus salmonis]